MIYAGFRRTPINRNGLAQSYSLLSEASPDPIYELHGTIEKTVEDCSTNYGRDNHSKKIPPVSGKPIGATSNVR
jgi:hypothetical protein